MGPDPATPSPDTSGSSRAPAARVPASMGPICRRPDPADGGRSRNRHFFPKDGAVFHSVVRRLSTMPHNLFPGLGAIPLLAGMLLALTPGGLPAQGVCQETCPNPLADPAGATLCAARIATCTGKLSLYQGYMSQLSLGAVKAQLNPLYIQILAPLFPTAGVTAWRFAWANRQPVNNSTTDCTTTYFNPNATYANTLAQGKLTQDWEFRLLYHELTHVEQCKAMGGRDRYAKIWFAQAELAFLRTANLDQIHDLQPMENDAAAKAATLLETTRRNRDASGALVPPQADLGIFSLSQSEDYRAGSCTVRISIENVGSAPLP